MRSPPLRRRRERSRTKPSDRPATSRSSLIFIKRLCRLCGGIVVRCRRVSIGPMACDHVGPTPGVTVLDEIASPCLEPSSKEHTSTMHRVM